MNIQRDFIVFHFFAQIFFFQIFLFFFSFAFIQIVNFLKKRLRLKKIVTFVISTSYNVFYYNSINEFVARNNDIKINKILFEHFCFNC